MSVVFSMIISYVGGIFLLSLCASSLTLQKDYTYPPITYGSTTIEVDKPLDLDMRREYIYALQRHWGLNPDPARRNFPPVDAPIFHRSPSKHTPGDGVPPTVDLPDQYEAYEKMKIFDGSTGVVLQEPTVRPVERFLVRLAVRDRPETPDDPQGKLGVLSPGRLEVVSHDRAL